jgi:hypothetical protein
MELKEMRIPLIFRLAMMAILVMAVTPALVQAQFAGTGTTTVSVAIGPEAALQVDTSTTNLTTTGTVFNPYTGTTNLTYKIRTTKTGGSGAITAQVTADFGAGGPSVAAPASGDELTYTCSGGAPATPCSTAQTIKTSTTTPVADFGANAHSLKAGNAASLAWTLPNDPAYETGTYTATVTFTISAT